MLGTDVLSRWKSVLSFDGVVVLAIKDQQPLPRRPVVSETEKFSSVGPSIVRLSSFNRLLEKSGYKEKMPENLSA